MRLKENQIKKLAEAVVAGLKTKNVATFTASDSKLVESVMKVFHDDMAMEARIDSEARALLDKFRAQAGGDVDEHQVFVRIKKQLAKDKKFVL